MRIVKIIIWVIHVLSASVISLNAREQKLVYLQPNLMDHQSTVRKRSPGSLRAGRHRCARSAARGASWASPRSSGSRCRQHCSSSGLCCCGSRRGRRLHLRGRRCRPDHGRGLGDPRLHFGHLCGGFGDAVGFASRHESLQWKVELYRLSLWNIPGQKYPESAKCEMKRLRFSLLKTI